MGEYFLFVAVGGGGVCVLFLVTMIQYNNIL
jgi:hypothetical protein